MILHPVLSCSAIIDVSNYMYVCIVCVYGCIFIQLIHIINCSFCVI